MSFVYKHVWTNGYGDNIEIDKERMKSEDYKYLMHDLPMECQKLNKITKWQYVSQVTLSKKQDILTSSSSYSYSKGLAGAALFGPIGAVAGIDGKKSYSTRQVGEDLYEITVKCGLCGETLTFKSNESWYKILSNKEEEKERIEKEQEEERERVRAEAREKARMWQEIERREREQKIKKYIILCAVLGAVCLLCLYGVTTTKW